MNAIALLLKLAIRRAPLAPATLPRRLLEEAGARAGSSAREAGELRRAALACLRGVR
jgi:hypothetical protein